MLAMHTSINDADWHDVQHRIFAPEQPRLSCLSETFGWVRAREC